MRIARSPDSTSVPTFYSLDDGAQTPTAGLVMGEVAVEAAVDILGSIFDGNSNGW